MSGEGVIVPGINITYTGLITVNKNAGNLLAYSIPNTAPYKLCYQFADEPYKLFENVLLYVRKVISVSAAKYGSFDM